jgi:Protein of unknown function (DUF998)
MNTKGTNVLLTSGAVAGPLWVVVVIVQMIIRPGFDISRHAVSALSLGDLGWIQITNFIVSGALVIVGAVGMRQALHPGRAGSWGPILIGLYGLGLVAAGIFHPDPVNGFPPGTPDVPVQMSGHGFLHLLSAAVGFLSLILAACVVFARRFASLRQRGWVAYSVVTGAFFFVTWVALGATGSRVGWIAVLFAVAVVLAWAWITVVAVGLLNQAKR